MCLSDDPPVNVSELICSAMRTWDTAKLETHFLPMDVEAIKQIPICYVRQPNFWAWHFDQRGIFTVKSAYHAIMETKRRREDYLEGTAAHSSSEQEERGWKMLWKVKVPSKLRVFAWRLTRSCLPTGEVLAERGMATTAICPVCNAAADTWRHALLECNMSMSVWAMKEYDVMLPLMADETDDPRLWLFSLSEALSKERFIEVLATLWSIWWVRRKFIHEGEQRSPMSTHCFITRYLEELSVVNWKDSRAGQRAPNLRSHNSWTPPRDGVVKIHVDAAVAKQEQRGAVGVVCRNSEGIFQGASAVVFDGVINPKVLEALACAEAFALANDLHVHKVQVTSDCLNVVREINGSEEKGQHCMIMREIRSGRNGFQEAVFIHECRDQM